MIKHCKRNIEEINQEYRNKMELLNFYDGLTKNQIESFMLLVDTLKCLSDKQEHKDDPICRKR